MGFHSYLLSPHLGAWILCTVVEEGWGKYTAKLNSGNKMTYSFYLNLPLCTHIYISIKHFWFSGSQYVSRKLNHLKSFLFSFSDSTEHVTFIGDETKQWVKAAGSLELNCPLLI